MSKLNPVSSVDGIHRADVRVTHRVSRADIVSLLEEYAASASIPGDELSARQVMAIIREDLWFNGAAVDSDAEPNESEKAWAERHAAKVWPTEGRG